MSYTANKSSIPSFKYRYELSDTGFGGGGGSSDAYGNCGFAKSNGTYTFNSGIIGIMCGPSVRMGGFSLTVPNMSYQESLTIGYFPYHDINTTVYGLGRSGSGNLGGGWDADACGFYFEIPNEIINGGSKFILEYNFWGDYYNKHGLKFYSSAAQPSGGSGSPNFDFLGTWDNTLYSRLPDNNIKKTIINRLDSANWVSSSLYTRRIVFTNYIQ